MSLDHVCNDSGLIFLRIRPFCLLHHSFHGLSEFFAVEVKLMGIFIIGVIEVHTLGVYHLQDLPLPNKAPQIDHHVFDLSFLSGKYVVVVILSHCLPIALEVIGDGSDSVLEVLGWPVLDADLARVEHF